ncbi:unnamed protein product [Didymodactylos carnosus]|uniref:Glycine amidinotransferase n=1 Tax=Didymodactylos carnosus TaxID=1234261 RepID=A0A8S2E9C7_9BILA|nr:unnamed protein product [Didymodactylos carnosus]CAF3978070.1 unnamed protein product [Didymodactylos carnosus]
MGESKPLVNSWTEFGQLELVCVGSAEGMCYPDDRKPYPFHEVPDENLKQYLTTFIGPRPPKRIQQAQEQLQNLCSLLHGEQIEVKDVEEIDGDIQQMLKRKRCSVVDQQPTTSSDDKRIAKPSIDILRAPSGKRFDHVIRTPHFESHYQFGLTCPRDIIITIGNTIVEAPTACHSRYFESSYYRELIYPLWNSDPKMKWIQPPRPTVSESMFNDVNYWDKTTSEQFKRDFKTNGYKTNLNENEIAFDAADLMRMGKDIFYKKDVFANNQGLKWLRRTFSPEVRFHAVHFPTDGTPHIDVDLIPLRPPSSGSHGIVLINQLHPPLKAEMKLFTDNDWRPMFVPLPACMDTPPMALCSPSLNMNLLSLSEKCVVIEECEIPLYHFLEDELGFDVITCPLRVLNEFGGGIHCVTWDIRRNDSCKDYFPEQNYEEECKIDLDNYFETEEYSVKTEDTNRTEREHKLN